jgi:hypothetical protein
MVEPEELYEPEWVAWFSLTPQERLAESAKLWQIYLEMGGRLDPDPDPQSPFFFPEDFSESAADGRPGVRVIRRGGV